MLRVLGLVLLFIVVTTSILGVGGWWYAERTLPVMDDVVTLNQLSHPAVVRYDDRAVPYIEASNDLDAYQVQGYVTAAERMFQMDVMRRTAEGRMSEMFGSSFMGQDRLMRTLGFKGLAAEEYKQLPADLKEQLNQYCKGVNAYIDRAQGRLPLEFVILGMPLEQWTAVDTLALFKYLQYEMDESWRLDDLRQRALDKVGDKFASVIFEQQMKQTKTSLVEPAQLQPMLSRALAQLKKVCLPAPLPIWGSNAWAVSPSLSDSKGCLLACDSHGPFQSPDKYYLCTLTTPNMHVGGATIPGVPGVVLGRNAYFAWGATGLKADTQDIVLEQLSPQFPGKYKTPDAWQNLAERDEYIGVRFSANPFRERVQITKHGPVLYKTESTAVCLNWSGFDTKTCSLETVFKINHAKNWQEFVAALEKYNGGSQTFIYADRQGNIGYHVAGNIPVRTSAGITLTPGWNGQADWTGRVKFSDLPNGYNPPQGYAVADDPEFCKLQYANNPLRAMRIGSSLQAYKRAGQKVGLPDMAVLQGDQNAALAALVKKEIEQALTKMNSNDSLQLSALELLKRWDGTLKGDSAAASIYESFITTMARRILEPRLGAELTNEYFERWPRWTLLVQKMLTEKSKDLLPAEERSYDTFIVTTFAQALKNERLEGQVQDPASCPWQSIHKITFKHLLDQNIVDSALLQRLFNVGPVGVGGDQDCINSCNVDVSSDPTRFACTSGPIQRLLVDLADNDKFYETVVLGQSGHLSSAYRCDQLAAWLKNEPHVLAFSSDLTEKLMQHKMILSNQ